MARIEIGTTIGQYTLLEKIGVGGMATVYLARQDRLDRLVALKLMHQTFLSDNNFVERFAREARIVASLDHPNIVPLFDFSDEGDQPYLIMKYVRGHTLKRRLNKEGVLSLDDILEVIPALADALTYAHSQGILHRDIKPSNIILDDTGTPYLMDFGLARVLQAGESTLSADMMLGTPHYISPEQAQGQEISARSDVYSLGVVLYELVVGRVPFTGDTPFIIVHKHIYNKPEPPSAINPEIPESVDQVILRALEKNPKDRYATPNDLADAFRNAVEQTNLRELDDSRLTRAREIRAELVMTMGGQNADSEKSTESAGSFIRIPAPIVPAEGVSAAEIIRAPQDYTIQGIIEDIIMRFREAIADILRQLQGGQVFQNINEKAPMVAVEIRENVERAIQSGIAERNQQREADLPSDAQSLQVRSDHRYEHRNDRQQRRRSSRSIQREWGTDEASIRSRLKRQAARRGRFLGNLVAFCLFGALMMTASGALNGFLLELAADPNLAFLEPLTQITIVPIILLFWASGLVGQGISLFYTSGGRLNRQRDLIDTTMQRRYGYDWREVASDAQYKQVRNRVRDNFQRRISFFRTITAAFFGFIALSIFSPAFYEMLPMIAGADAEIVNFFNGLWSIEYIFLALIGIAIVVQGVVLLINPIVGREAVERSIDRELERSVATKAKRKETHTPPPVRLNEDGEFTDSLIEELEQNQESELGKEG